MKVFIRENNINFVDKNNVFVGLSTVQRCCERVSAYIVTAQEEHIDITLNLGNIPPCVQFYIKDVHELSLTHDKNQSIIDFPKLTFDTRYFKTSHNYGDGVAVFKFNELTYINSQRSEDTYLILLNCHNGYYSHGFKMSQNDLTLFEGGI